MKRALLLMGGFLLLLGCAGTGGPGITLNESVSGSCVENHSFEECVDACIPAPVPSGSLFNECYHNTVQKELELLQSKGCPSGDGCMSVDEFRRIASKSCGEMVTVPGPMWQLGDDYKKECLGFIDEYH